MPVLTVGSDRGWQRASYASWLALTHTHPVCLCLQMQCVVLPLLGSYHPTAEHWVAAMNWSLVLLVTVLWFSLGFIDPADPPKECAASTEHTFCSYCDAWYSSPNRKHCHTCHRCVSGFDHHCSYLNCCIGRRNYPCFFGLVIATMLASLLHLLLSAYVLVLLFATEAAATHALHSVGWEISLLLVLALLAASLATMFLFGNLFLFHTFLARRPPPATLRPAPASVRALHHHRRGMSSFEYWGYEYDDVAARRIEWQMALYDADLSLCIMRCRIVHPVWPPCCRIHPVAPPVRPCRPLAQGLCPSVLAVLAAAAPAAAAGGRLSTAGAGRAAWRGTWRRTGSA